MTITTLSSRQFSQDASGARKAAQNGPVIITHRGRPAHALLTIEQYQQLIGQQANIVDLLAMSRQDEAEFDAPPVKGSLYRPAN